MKTKLFKDKNATDMSQLVRNFMGKILSITSPKILLLLEGGQKTGEFLNKTVFFDFYTTIIVINSSR